MVQLIELHLDPMAFETFAMARGLIPRWDRGYAAHLWLRP